MFHRDEHSCGRLLAHRRTLAPGAIVTRSFDKSPGSPRDSEKAAPVRAVVASGERSIAIDTWGGHFLGNAITGDNVTIVQAPPGELKRSDQVDSPKRLVRLRSAPSARSLLVSRDEALSPAPTRFKLKRGSGVRALVITGLGGIGKSTLAEQYVGARTRRYNPIWWIDAETPAQISHGLAELARRLYPDLARHDDARAAEWGRDWLATHAAASGGDLRSLDKDQRFEVIGRLAKDVMAEIASLVPVLPVSLIATVLLEAREPLDELELKVRAHDLMAHFEGRGAKLYLPRGDRDYAFDVGLRMLELRHLVEEPEAGLFAAVAAERPVLAYYANAIAHLR